MKKRPENHLLVDAKKIIRATKNVDEFVQRLIECQSLEIKEKTAWHALEFFITELSKADRAAKLFYLVRLTGLINYYYSRSVRDPAYLQLADSVKLTSHLLFRLRKCIHPDSELSFKSDLINGLLKLFLRQAEQAEPIHLCSAILGVGYLAAFNHIDGVIDGQLINHALLSLVRKSNSANLKHLCNALMAAGYLAQYNKLQGIIDASFVNQILLSILKNRENLEPWHIGNALFGPAQLVKTRQLKGNVGMLFVNELLTVLSQFELEDRSQDIVNALFSMSLIARQQNLSGKINARCLQILLRKLDYNSELINAEICSSVLVSMGLLARQECLVGNLDAILINQLLQALAERSSAMHTEELCNVFLVLSDSLFICHVEGEIISDALSRLLRAFINKSPIETGTLCRILNSLVYLAHHNRLEGKLNIKVLNALLKMLNELLSVMYNKHLIEIVTCVELLNEKELFSGKINPNLLDPLTAVFRPHPVVADPPKEEIQEQQIAEPPAQIESPVATASPKKKKPKNKKRGQKFFDHQNAEPINQQQERKCKCCCPSLTECINTIIEKVKGLNPWQQP